MKFQFLFLLLFFTHFNAFACEKARGESTPTIYFPAKFDSAEPEKDYVFQLLQLILSKSTDQFGPCEVKLAAYKAPLKRMQHYLENGKEIDVVALTVSHKRDFQLRPIKLPISKGLVGYRVLMVHANNKDKFDNVKSIKELSQYIAGQGTNWPDVKILQSNDLPLTTSGSV